MRAYHARFSSRCQEFSTYPKDRKKTFPQPKIFFRTAFLARSAISTKNKQPTHRQRARYALFHRNCVEKCRNVWKNDSKFTQLSTSFPKPYAPQPQKFPRPAFSARSFFAAHFSFVAASKFPERSARVFYHQRKIHARISAENPSIKIRPYFKNTPILSSKTSEKSPRNTQKPLTNAHLYSKLIDACKLGHRRCEYETHISAKE